MKRLLTALFVMISASTMAYPAFANEENVSPPITNHGRAAALMTQPATITNGTVSITERTNNLRKVSDSIGVVREPKCKKINPVELIKSPANTLKQCLEETNNQASQINQTSQPTETFDFFKVPELDSGINVTVTKF
ncbi:MAG: hypothetical protein HC862_12640 [Scytonema sp. RU_4_4]|nr:hypothetical protein [Scytonema sp. RU_4_4]NJR76319.1 hypothetical protein [Scytonema sp. CRU_2_7]